MRVSEVFATGGHRLGGGHSCACGYYDSYRYTGEEIARYGYGFKYSYYNGYNYGGYTYYGHDRGLGKL
jgi:hypothetical protein